MAIVTFDDNKCKGCRLCVTACPKKIIDMSSIKVNDKGFHTPEINDIGKCAGCAFCAIICPDCAISVAK